MKSIRVRIVVEVVSDPANLHTHQSYRLLRVGGIPTFVVQFLVRLPVE
jgi:hypothetical protein